MHREQYIHNNPTLEQKWLHQNKNWHRKIVTGAKSSMEQYFRSNSSQKIRSNAKKELLLEGKFILLPFFQRKLL
jgi:hypothetical protein